MKKIFLLISVCVFSSCTTLDFISDRIISPEQISSDTVVFRFKSSTARIVTIAGDFNGWEYRPDQPRTVKMKKQSSDLWIAEVKGLQPGRYQYKFVIDYQMWILDPNNPYTIDDGTGNRNSLLIVR